MRSPCVNFIPWSQTAVDKIIRDVGALNGFVVSTSVFHDKSIFTFSLAEMKLYLRSKDRLKMEWWENLTD